jgi:mRNA interferase MazF
MKRGEVWWANLPAPAGRRPVVLVSRNDAYVARSLVIAVPVSTRVRQIPTEVELGRDEGLPRRCVANADAIVTVPKALLVERAGQLGGDKLTLLDDALRFALEIEGPA